MFKQKFKKIITCTTLFASLVYSANRPFPQAVDFQGCIKPNNVSQSEMNNSITSLYTEYRDLYLKSYSGNRYYIDASGNGDGGNSSLTISEAHGYGMIIFALMAGFDSNAQDYFNGMYRFFTDCPSENNSYLMSWIADISSSAATDGDMDIAYALILADKQWGSNGEINYLDAANTLLTNGIKASEMGSTSKRTLLGDWDRDQYTTRSSDWMAGHMHAYFDATGDEFWDQAADTVYSLIEKITQNYSPNTGLMPDFIAGSTPYPDGTGGGTYETNAEQYYYNACRFPWRIALDYAHNGTPEAQAATSKILGWLRSTTGGDAARITNGYSLDGTALGRGSDIVFTAPFAAGAITDSENQSFLNSMWSEMKNESGNNEYAHALNLLSMLLISGNWWAPSEVSYVAPSTVMLSGNSVVEESKSGTFIGKISTDGNGAPFIYTLTAGGANFSISNDSLFTNGVASGADSPLSVTITATDKESNSAMNSFRITVVERAENILSGLGWYVTHDDYGVTSVDTGSSLVDNQIVSATFNMGTSRVNRDQYVFGTVQFDEFTGTIEQNGTVVLTYRSDEAFALEFQTTDVEDFAFHAVPLPSTNNQWKQVVLTIDGNTFVQPGEWGEDVVFNSENVSTIAITTQYEGTSGTIEMSELSITGLTTIAESVSTVQHLQKSSVQINAAIVNRNLNLTIPEAGDYTVSLYSLNGQKLFTQRQSFSEGFHSVSLDGVSVGAQILVVEIVHDTNRALFKTAIR